MFFMNFFFKFLFTLMQGRPRPHNKNLFRRFNNTWPGILRISRAHSKIDYPSINYNSCRLQKHPCEDIILPSLLIENTWHSLHVNIISTNRMFFMVTRVIMSLVVHESLLLCGYYPSFTNSKEESWIDTCNHSIRPTSS